IGSGWFTVGFEAGACSGTPPADFPRFHKLVRAVRTGFTDPPDSRLDYALVQIDAGPSGVGAPPIQIRTTPVTVGTQLFGVHHPRGARKKVSQAVPTPLCSVSNVNSAIVTFDCDVDNGSSGSSIFDTNGEVVGVADWAGDCNNRAQAATVVRPDFLTPLPLSADVDAVAVFDRSGSMNLPAPGGASKLAEAKEAASLFFDLLRTDANHQAGLVSFNQAPSNDHDLAPIDATAKDDLIRISPTPGAVASISAGGNTSIGAGLQLGQQRLDAVGTVNTKTLLLMTDGLQNTAPSIEDVEPSLADTRICAIGFGSEASLDGPLLSRLARDHGGLYTRADRGLDLRKFFALCFGLIFESGISMDPDYHLHAGQTLSEEIPIPVCGETDLTVVVAWEERANFLLPVLRTPGGATVDSSTPGVTSSLGPTWSYLRFPLPLAGERDGTWTLVAHRPEGSGEFGQPLGHQDFAVVTVIDGGPTLKPAVGRPLYTGDLLDPLVILRDDDGDLYPAEIAVEVERPTEGTGNLLTASGLGPAKTVDGDSLDARVSTLLDLEAQAGGQLVPTTTFSLTLRDDGVDDERALEPDGQYGARVPDLLTREGHYTFHARARFGNSCTAQRETFWSTYVAVGV
ncbi:MAG TPA: trypsin-like peptidase domain-containing protein, partial [Thermoanaerobaculia bacterium]|nr:trypsin-like peptidase domain-containing protein [Thermoanaerobaculia bacterium]